MYDYERIEKELDPVDPARALLCLERLGGESNIETVIKQWRNDFYCADSWIVIAALDCLEEHGLVSTFTVNENLPKQTRVVYKMKI